MSEGGPCLITGATGFIGAHLARRLVSEGRPVRCLVRARSDISVLARLDLELVRGDLGDPASLPGALAGCRYVVHCGALVSDWATVQEILRVNVAGTRNLLQAARAASVQRFLHISTTDVYGHPGGPPLAEDAAPIRPRNWYARAKLLAEQELCRVLAEQELRQGPQGQGPQGRGAAGVPRGAAGPGADGVRGGADGQPLETVIIRPATVYGPGSRAVLGEIGKALRAGNMVLIGRGGAVAGLCYVENLVDLIVLALDAEAAVGEAFNASDGLEVTWRQLTDDLARGIGAPAARFSIPYPLAYTLGLGLEQGYRLARRATGVSTRPLLSRQAVQVLGRDQRFSNRKAKALLGWEPKIGYAEGLELTLQWLRSELA